MIITPDIQTLKFKMCKGVKYFELFAEQVEQEILPGVFIKGWWYNCSHQACQQPHIQYYHSQYDLQLL